jgi:hypothetical protein
MWVAFFGLPRHPACGLRAARRLGRGGDRYLLSFFSMSAAVDSHVSLERKNSKHPVQLFEQTSTQSPTSLRRPANPFVSSAADNLIRQRLAWAGRAADKGLICRS